MSENMTAGTEGAAEVPLSFAKALLVQARSFGQDVDAILRGAGFTFNPLTDDNPRSVTVAEYSRLCLRLFEALDDESGGIIRGIATPVGATRMLAYSMINCRTLEQALMRAIEFNAACRERNGTIRHHTLNRSDDGRLARLAYLSEPGTQQGQDAVLCSMAVWLRFCSWLIDRNIDPVAAGCAGRAPRNRAGLRHFFHRSVTFDEPVNWIEFAAMHLDSPIVRGEAELEAFLREAPYHVVIKPVIGEKSVTARIRELIGDDFRRELPRFRELTRQLNMSARTLRRRLEREGTSYQQIKDNARRDAAIDYLANPELTVSDVAELVGFSDPSAFHRSFKRWTGRSPVDFRCQQDP